MHTNLHTLSARLHYAREHHTTLDAIPPEMVPANPEASFEIQHETMRLMHAQIGGWKVGGKTPTAPVVGAPLPLTGIYKTGAEISRKGFTPPALELEIAFRFNRSFEPSSTPYDEALVMGSIGTMCPTIEILSSRLSKWPNENPMTQLADLQSHGALVVGESIPYQADYPFLSPALSFEFNGESVLKAPVKNPSGDPRRTLPWLVNHCAGRGITVTPDTIITTGSYTGVYLVEHLGLAIGKIPGFDPVTVKLL
jgi:2-keto-4-pentenoate hydratase